MKHRGRVLRDTNSGPGLISVDGKQLQFKLEEVWKSSLAPTPNMIVEVEINEAGEIVTASAVDETQLAKEQASAAMNAAKEKGLQVFGTLQSSVGTPVLISIAALIVSWFLLNTLTIQLTPSMKQGISFWQILSAINSPETFAALQQNSGQGAGIYGFFGFAALAGPFLSRFWRHPAAHLGYVLPFAFMLIIVLMVYSGINDGISSAGDMAQAFGGSQAKEMVASMTAKLMKQVMQAISLGLGAYLAIVASGYLGFIGIKKYLAAKAAA